MLSDRHAGGALRGLDVVVLAGGLGSRLRGVLGETPKVLAPVHGQPFLAHLLERLAWLGASRAILSLGHRAAAVQAYLDARLSPLDVLCVVETRPLGTAGGLRLAARLARTDPLLVVNGDTWLEADYAAFLAGHAKSCCPGSVLCVPAADCRRYGRVEIDRSGGIRRFVEKGDAAGGAGMISGGVYLFSAQALQALGRERGASLERDFLQTRAPGAWHGHVAVAGTFLDIGTPESLRLAPAVIPRPFELAHP